MRQVVAFANDKSDNSAQGNISSKANQRKTRTTSENNNDAKNAVCRDFLRNRCTRPNCKFLHPGQEKNDDKPLNYNNRTEMTVKDKRQTREQVKMPKKKNTESFEPLDRPVDMRIVTHCAGSEARYPYDISDRDVILVHSLFGDYAPGEIYERLTSELACGDIETKLWHGDTHFIVDDKRPWKSKVPTYYMVLDRLAEYFDMDVQATRLNIYSDTAQWKPFHHDAAAVDPEKAKIQNFTLAVSFGACRDAAFEHARTRTVLSMPQGDGSIYAFAKQTNIDWKHGILKEGTVRNDGRVSIILWGKIY